MHQSENETTIRYSIVEFVFESESLFLSIFKCLFSGVFHDFSFNKSWKIAMIMFHLQSSYNIYYNTNHTYIDILSFIVTGLLYVKWTCLCRFKIDVRQRQTERKRYVPARFSVHLNSTNLEHSHTEYKIRRKDNSVEIFITMCLLNHITWLHLLLIFNFTSSVYI